MDTSECRRDLCKERPVSGTAAEDQISDDGDIGYIAGTRASAQSQSGREDRGGRPRDHHGRQDMAPQEQIGHPDARLDIETPGGNPLLIAE